MLNKYTYLSKQYYVLFTIGLLAKLFTILTYSPAIVQELFTPFVDYIIQHPFQNPYNHFYTIEQLNIFPYGSLMFIIFGWLKWIFYLITGNMFTTIPLMLSLLLVDIALFIVLLKKLKKQTLYVILFYWLSPLTFYITYIHGQLDIIPTLFLMVSFYFLDSRLGLVSLFLGTAIAIKTNNFLVVPFFLIYLYKNHATRTQYIKYILYLILPYFLFNGVYLFSKGFLNIVLFNNIQSQLLDIAFVLPNVSIYLIPLLYGLLVVRFFSYPYIVKDLFILFSTLTFSLITIFLPPQPGWFFWMIPLFVYSIIKYDKTFLYIYFIWTIVITSFFIINHSMIYTVAVLLQVVLSIHLFFKILNQYINSKILYHPYFIGIAGDSGTGKTQFSQSIQEFFGSNFSIVFCGDDLHKWERGHEQWQNLTHLNPVAQDLYNNIRDFVKLKQGKKIIRRHYDHHTGMFLEIKDVISKNIVIHEGLHSLYLPQERKFYDLKIFIDPQNDLYHQWKIERDHTYRGYSIEKVLESIQKRLPDKEKYIDVQRQYADIVVSYYIYEHAIDSLGLRVTTNMLLDLDPLLEKLRQLSSLEFTIEMKDFQQIVDIHLLSQISSVQWLEILLELCPHLEDYPFEINFKKQNYEGFLLCFTLYNMLNMEILND